MSYGWGELAAAVTEERARLIRNWRVDQGITYRGVAEEWSSAIEPDLPFAQQVNKGSLQQLGKKLCELSATELGEDCELPPWN